ncbi:MAG: peptidoglycan-binding domain-containing protein [Bacteroidota bacterium]
MKACPQKTKQPAKKHQTKPFFNAKDVFFKPESASAEKNPFFGGIGAGAISGNIIQRDLATPPPATPPAPQPALTARQIRSAKRYNRRRYRRRRTRIIQDLVGADITGSWDDQTIEMIAQLQEEYGLTKDGKVGPTTMTWLSNEQGLEGIGTGNNDVIYSFYTPSGNLSPIHAVRGTQDWIQKTFDIRAVFPDRTGCRNWEYRQEIRGNAWAQRPGFRRINVNHYFNLLPTPLHPTTWNEDGNTSWAGVNYGHRSQPGRASNPINRYETISGSPNQRNGCVFKSEDTPGFFDANSRTGDIFTLQLEFAGGIYRRDPRTSRLKVVERRTWTINGSITLP